MSDKVVIEELLRVIPELLLAADNAAEFLFNRGNDREARALLTPAARAELLLGAIGKPLRVVTRAQFAKGWVRWPAGEGVTWEPYERLYDTPDGDVVVVNPESK